MKKNNPKQRDASFNPTTYPPDQNPVRVYLERLGLGSRKAMGAALGKIAGILSDSKIGADSFPWAELRYHNTTGLRGKLESRYAPATANRFLAALKGILQESWRLGLMSAEDFHRATDLRTIKREKLPNGRRISQGEFIALVGVCRKDETNHGPRDASVFALGYVAGLRRSEIVKLDLADWTPDTGELRVHNGKGGRDRVVFVKNGAAKALSAWIERRGKEPGPLLFALTKSGKITGRRMSTQAAQDVCSKRAREAGIPEFTPHDLRRSCASDLLDAGMDLAAVQRHLGHSNIATTIRYDRRSDAVLHATAQRLHFPWQ